MVRTFALTSFVLGLAGCAPDERMPLSECEFGLYWADCGGNGEAVLGCDRETGDCRWFEGGETARGYAVSDCTPSGSCCDGSWPFSDYEPGERSIRRNLDAQMSLLRWEVVSREATNDVTVAPDLEGGTSVGVIRCGADGFPGCDTGGGWVERVGVAVVLTAGGPWGPSGGWHRMEMVPSESADGWTVRLYGFGAMFDEGQNIPLACGYFTTGLLVPLSGVLHVNTLDTSDLEAFHGRLEATTDTGAEFTMEF